MSFIDHFSHVCTLLRVFLHLEETENLELSHSVHPHCVNVAVRGQPAGFSSTLLPRETQGSNPGQQVEQPMPFTEPFHQLNIYNLMFMTHSLLIILYKESWHDRAVAVAR